MESVSKWLLTDAEKDSFIATLTPHLAVLRTQADVSQEEIANLIGISRQTYSAIERKVRKMSWNTYILLSMGIRLQKSVQNTVLITKQTLISSLNSMVSKMQT